MQKTVDELALEDQKEDEEWPDDDHCAGGDERPLRADFAKLREHGETNGEWSTGRAVSHDQGPEKIVPVKTDRRERERNHCGTRGRNVDVPQGLQPIRAVHARGVVQIARDCLERLAHQERAERRAEERQHHRDERVEEVKLANGRIVRNDERARWDHQLQENQKNEDKKFNTGFTVKQIAKTIDTQKFRPYTGSTPPNTVSAAITTEIHNRVSWGEDPIFVKAPMYVFLYFVY